MDCIRALVPALITKPEQGEMTKKCHDSLVSLEHCVKAEVDKKPYKAQVAGVWNVFLSKWKGKEYSFLLITANDVEHDPLMIDYMVKCAEENPNAGIISCRVTRDYDKFKKNFGQQEYTGALTEGLKDPATFMLRKGVVEKVGRIDEWFPCEFVERDYIYRAKLAGFEWVQPDLELSYHPPFAGTIGNDGFRLQRALRRYLDKWGGDANGEVYEYPFNDLSKDFTYCVK